MNQPAGPLQPDITRRKKAGPEDFLAKEDYVSRDFARLEQQRLWPRTWQMACREEEIPRVGDYVTNDVLDESIIVVRVAPDPNAADHNVCQHRGRRPTKGCGHAARLYCRFHGWSWKRDGSIAHVVDRDNWDGSLKDEDIALPKVRVDSWGGWVFICMSEQTEPLLDFLAPIPEIFRNYPFAKMRYRWYKSNGIACNWETALEAFNEGYHVQTTHTQLLAVHDAEVLAHAEGRHGSYQLAPGRISLGDRSPRVATTKVDYRHNVRDFILMLEQDLKASIPPHMAALMDRLVDQLPEDASLQDVMMKYGQIGFEAAQERKFPFPMLTSEEITRAGADWHLFPNMVSCPRRTRCSPIARDPTAPTRNAVFSKSIRWSSILAVKRRRAANVRRRARP